MLTSRLNEVLLTPRLKEVLLTPRLNKALLNNKAKWLSVKNDFGSYLLYCKKTHGTIVCSGGISMYGVEISTVWKGRKKSDLFIYGCNPFSTSCMFHILSYLLPSCLLITPTDPCNDFQECLEWFTSVYWIIAMGPRNDFHGYIEIFPWVHRNISVGHKVLLNSSKYFWNNIIPTSLLGVVTRVSLVIWRSKV